MVLQKLINIPATILLTSYFQSKGKNYELKERIPFIITEDFIINKTCFVTFSCKCPINRFMSDNIFEFSQMPAGEYAIKESKTSSCISTKLILKDPATLRQILSDSEKCCFYVEVSQRHYVWLLVDGKWTVTASELSIFPISGMKLIPNYHDIRCDIFELRANMVVVPHNFINELKVLRTKIEEFLLDKTETFPEENNDDTESSENEDKYHIVSKEHLRTIQTVVREIRDHIESKN